MVGKEKYKLGDREIEIRGLSFSERAPIKDEINERFIRISDGLKDQDRAFIGALSFEICGKIIKIGTELGDSDLDEMDDIQVKDLASAILNKSFINDDLKKK